MIQSRRTVLTTAAGLAVAAGFALAKAFATMLGARTGLEVV